MALSQIGAGGVGAGAITANTVLSTGVITADLIATGNVGTSEIANLSITDSKITSNAVTSAKIRGNAVGALQLNANACVGDIAASNGVFTHNSNTYKGAQAGYVTTITNAGGNGYGTQTITLNFANSNIFNITLANNCTLGSPSNMTVGQGGSIIVTQDGTGSRTLAFSDYWEFPSGTAPTLTTTASGQDRLDYIVVGSNAIHTVASLDLQ
tara:strand:- start:609 stop:1241 length:633 start_codon:yes stop_codon:yes gene_type:complete